MRRIKRSVVIVAFLIIVLTLSFSKLYKGGITGAAVDSGRPTGEPTFTNIVTTVYYSPFESDFGVWSTGAKREDYKKDGELSWCYIYEDERGFYEEVKCQGSGLGNDGKVYYYETIQEDKASSKPHPRYLDHKQGVTSYKERDPKPHRTIAVNPNAGTDCYIPYDSNVYLDFGADNPWTGWYVAEDTGSAFGSECKIDVFAGAGKEKYKEAEGYVSKKKPKVYVQGIEPTTPSVTLTRPLEEVSVDQVGKFGFYVFRPSFSEMINYDLYGYNKLLTDWSKEVVQECPQENDMHQCVIKKLKILNDANQDFTVLLGACDNNQQEEFYYNVEKIMECIASADTDCYCSLSEEDAEGIPFNLKKLQNNKAKISLDQFSYTINNIGLIESELTLSEDEFLYKTKEGKVDVVDKKDKAKACSRKKQFYRFCMRTTKEYVVGNKIQPITTKFALYLEDLPPPPIENLKVDDKQKAEDSVVIQWDKSPDTDVEEYIVYYSEENFLNYPMEKTVEETKDETEEPKQKTIKDNDNIKTKTFKLNQIKELEQAFELPTCYFDYVNKKCTYASTTDSSKKIPEPNAEDGFSFKDQKQIYLFLNGLEDSKQYYFAVTAVDKEGQEIDNVKERQKLKGVGPKVPEDDLEPGPVTLTIQKTSEGKLLLSWTTPEKLIGEGLADDVNEYRLYMSSASPNSVNERDRIEPLATITGTSREVLPTQSGTYYFYAVAYDKAGNPKERPYFFADNVNSFEYSD